MCLCAGEQSFITSNLPQINSFWAANQEPWQGKSYGVKDVCVCLVLAPEELRSIIQEVKYRTGLQSTKLIRQLRRRDRLCHKLQKNYDIITAFLQAVSQKRRKNTWLTVFSPARWRYTKLSAKTSDIRDVRLLSSLMEVRLQSSKRQKQTFKKKLDSSVSLRKS